jgi:hypothetical protein
MPPVLLAFETWLERYPAGRTRDTVLAIWPTVTRMEQGVTLSRAENVGAFRAGSNSRRHRSIGHTATVRIQYSQLPFELLGNLDEEERTLSGAREVLLQGSFCEVSLALVGVASLA